MPINNITQDVTHVICQCVAAHIIFDVYRFHRIIPAAYLEVSSSFSVSIFLVRCCCTVDQLLPWFWGGLGMNKHCNYTHIIVLDSGRNLLCLI